VVGKAMLSKEEQAKWGNYPELGKKMAAAIPGAQLKVLPGIGHIPHIQDFDAFRRTAEPFLEK
jgi:pimeloyl-ACP methyl ester carboxylesterase